MKVLVVGGGGREHALVYSLSHSPRVGAIVAAPGNAGIAALARCMPIAADDIAGLIRLAQEEQPGLVIVGPEVPLALGLVDALTARGIRCFGPTRAAAQLESSKSFAKQIMQEYDVPTAAYAICESMDDAMRELPRFGLPVVVKADGLAAGKGVVICQTPREAEAAVAQAFSGTLTGKAEPTVMLEQFLTGDEISFFALCDGTHAIAIAAAQDHKRIGEGDTGPNTGGMGAYSTDALLPPELSAWLLKHVAQPVVDAMRFQGHPFQGILFCGMMMTPQPDGTVLPMVLEFNTRWGDPETEALVLRIETDLLDLFEAAVDGTLDRLPPMRLKPGASACVVAASGGYPGDYASGKPISGLEQHARGSASADDANTNDADANESAANEAIVFHAGTKLRDGQVITAGGRVLVVSAAAPTLKEALNACYRRLEPIHFEGMQLRRDIGWRALAKETA
jgi:phosphoribosylamine--glycine ligase